MAKSVGLWGPTILEPSDGWIAAASDAWPPLEKWPGFAAHPDAGPEAEHWRTANTQSLNPLLGPTGAELAGLPRGYFQYVSRGIPAWMLESVRAHLGRADLPAASAGHLPVLYWPSDSPELFHVRNNSVSSVIVMFQVVRTDVFILAVLAGEEWTVGPFFGRPGGVTVVVRSAGGGGPPPLCDVRVTVPDLDHPGDTWDHTKLVVPDAVEVV